MTTGIAVIFLVLLSPLIALIYFTQGSVGVDEFMQEIIEGDIMSEASNFIIILINYLYRLF